MVLQDIGIDFILTILQYIPDVLSLQQISDDYNFCFEYVFVHTDGFRGRTLTTVKE